MAFLLCVSNIRMTRWHTNISMFHLNPFLQVQFDEISFENNETPYLLQSRTTSEVKIKFVTLVPKFPL